MILKTLIITTVVFTYSLSHARFSSSGDEHSLRPLYQKQRLDFTSILTKRFADIYSEKFKNKKIRVIIDWEKTNINAYASFDEYDNPFVSVTGGMAGHELMDADSIALVICHEIGHFLGGSPKQNRGRSTKKSWSSAEGQADYYASSKCMKALLSGDEILQNISFDSVSLNPQVLDDILRVCGGDLLCQRIVQASYRLSQVYAQIKYHYRHLRVLRPSPEVVTKTNLSHPDPQCRLDTMIAGALCPSSQEIHFQPGQACIDPRYDRPQCWYFSK